MTAIVRTAPMNVKYRPLGTFIVVIAAHIAVLVALAMMKPISLKRPEPSKPVQVRFVQIAPPKPKVEPPKPKVVTKPKEVKIVKEQPKPKPLPKPKPVLTTPTPSEKPQAVVAPPPAPEPVKQPEPAPAPPPPPSAPKAEPKPEPAAPVTPQLVEGVSYIRPPRLEVSDSELRGQSRVVKLRISINTAGRVDAVEVVSSSGVTALDQKVARALKKATFTPHRVNGVAVPVYTIQPFELNLSN